MLDELYKEYGELIIKAKIVQGRLGELEKQIVEELSKSSKKKVEK